MVLDACGASSLQTSKEQHLISLKMNQMKVVCDCRFEYVCHVLLVSQRVNQ